MLPPPEKTLSLWKVLFYNDQYKDRLDLQLEVSKTCRYRKSITSSLFFIRRLDLIDPWAIVRGTAMACRISELLQ